MSSNELKDDDYICNSWEVPNGVSYISQSTLSTAFCIFLRPTKEEVNAFARVCLSVCLSVSKITQKRVHGFGWNVACRQMLGHGRTDQLLSPIRIIVRMPERNCFLPYRMLRGISRRESLTYTYWSLQRRVVLQWFHSLRQWAVETPLSEVHVLHRVPF